MAIALFELTRPGQHGSARVRCGGIARECRVVMDCEEIDRDAGDFKYSGVPSVLIFADAFADSDQLESRIDRAHGLRILDGGVGVGGRVGMSAHPIAEHFIAKLPLPHAPGSGMSVCGTQRAVSGSRRTVYIFNPGCGFRRCRASTVHVHGDRWFDAEAAAEGEVLVGAKVVRLGRVTPGDIRPDGAQITRPNAPLPVVILRNVTAGPA